MGALKCAGKSASELSQHELKPEDTTVQKRTLKQSFPRCALSATASECCRKPLRCCGIDLNQIDP
jgi:hypothetical protein